MEAIAQDTIRGGISKVLRYRWTIFDEQGKFEWIPKELLDVDYTYQRQPKHSHILRIAKDWSWIACGTIAVTERDNKYFIIDGNHRKLASDKRDDISELPCMIYRTKGITDEAKSWLSVNTSRKHPYMYEKWNALVCIGDANVIDIIETLRATGHTISPNQGASNVAFPAALLRAWQSDAMLAKSLWPLCVSVHNGEYIHSDIWEGLFYLQRILNLEHPKFSVSSKNNIEKLKLSGRSKILEEISKAKSFFHKGGPRVYAMAIVQILNWGRADKNRIEIKS